MDSPRLRVCLERSVEVGAAHLRLRDWPGLDGPLVHLACRAAGGDARRGAVDWLADAFAPRYRVMSVEPRGDTTYQVDTADLLAVLDQFGFTSPVLVGEGLSCLPVLLLAAWHAQRVAGLIMLDPTYAAPTGASIAARALRECPPDWPALRASVVCPTLIAPADASLVVGVEALLGVSRRPSL